LLFILERYKRFLELCFRPHAIQSIEKPIVRSCLFQKRQLLLADGSPALRKTVAGGVGGEEGVSGDEWLDL